MTGTAYNKYNKKDWRDWLGGEPLGGEITRGKKGV
jgi:hypothetical protein